MPLHPPGTLESGIDADKMIGLVDPTTVTEVEAQPEAEVKKSDKIPLGQIIGLPDFAVRLSVPGPTESGSITTSYRIADFLISIVR
jgi:hypothetical protein